MDQPGPILDYASPRPRVKVRLPSYSLLNAQIGAGKCIIIETLAGQNGAIGALIFSAFVLVAMTGPTIDAFSRNYWQESAFMPALALSIIGLSLLVIRNTWRKTVVAIEDGEFSMTSSAPFMAKHRYAWPAADIADVRVLTTDEWASLGELRIFPKNGAELHLFTDHSLVQLRGLAMEIRKALCGDEPPGPKPVASL